MKRVLTALLLIPLVVGLIFHGPVLAVRAALTVAALLCLREAFDLAKAAGAPPYRTAGYAAGAMLVALPGLPHPAFLTAFTLLLLCLTLFNERPLSGNLHAVAGTLFSIVYACGPFALAVLLHGMSPHWLFLTLALNWIGDSAAYYAGRGFGKRKLAPRISPGKTWEGTAASAILATACGTAYLLYFHPAEIAPWLAVAFSLGVNVAGQMGDLAESALKRGAGVKDSGSLLPGHGGMLDRMDGALFSLAGAYLVLTAAG